MPAQRIAREQGDSKLLINDFPASLPTDYFIIRGQAEKSRS